MIDDDVMTRRVGDSLRAYAQLVPDRPRAFDPTHRMVDVLGADDADVLAARRRTTGRAPLIALVAATAVALAGVTGWVLGPNGGDTGSTQLVTLSAPVTPSDGLAPTAGPDGWELSHVDWSTATASTSAFGPLQPVEWESFGARAQLFGDPADPGVLLLLESGGGVLPEDLGEPVSVRGQSGYVMPSQARGVIGPTRPDVTVVTWTEGGTELRASFRGLGRDRALAVLDGLQVRAGGPAAGFDPAAGTNGLRLLDEAQPSPTPATQVSVAYRAPGSSADGPTLGVDAVSATGQTTVPYLNAWFYGERAADGTATVWDPSTSTRTIVGPDGQTVRTELYTLDEADSVVPADGVEGVGTAEELTAEIAASVAPVGADQLTRWWEAVSDDRTSLSVLAQVELPTATIEVRGDDDGRVLCYQAPGEIVCYPARFDDPEGNVSMQVRIAGTDYALAASPVGVPEIVAYGPDGPYAVEAETGSDGDWSVALAPAPGDPYTVYAT